MCGSVAEGFSCLLPVITARSSRSSAPLRPPASGTAGTAPPDVEVWIPACGGSRNPTSPASLAARPDRTGRFVSGSLDPLRPDPLGAG